LTLVDVFLISFEKGTQNDAQDDVMSLKFM